MAFYTSALRFENLTTIRRARKLPFPGEVLIPIGKEVGAEDLVARGSDFTNYQILKASETLRVDASSLEKYLLVEQGNRIKKGTPLMRRPGLFGRSKVFRSPVDGLVLLIEDGYLVIQRESDPVEIRALMPGRVVSVISDRGVIIESIGALIQAAWDSGKDGSGRLLTAADYPDEGIKQELVGNRARGAILVAGRISDLDELQRYEDQGVRGLITGSLTWQLRELVRDVSYPVFVTDGFGSLPMAEPIFHYLSKSEGREVSLLAADSGPRTQPAEIFVPLPSTTKVEGGLKTITEGSTVRVVQPGNNMAIGSVVKLYKLTRKNQLGTVIPGADVQLTGGETKFFPYTNLELLHN